MVLQDHIPQSNSRHRSSFVKSPKSKVTADPILSTDVESVDKDADMVQYRQVLDRSAVHEVQSVDEEISYAIEFDVPQLNHVFQQEEL